MTPEEIKNARKLAYQKAKAARDANPVYQALKEKHRQMQKQRYKEQAEKKQRQKKELRLAQQKAKDEELAEITGFFETLRLLKFD